MPVELSYPGVYVQEVPSGVRTITGVATSITAFVGRALRGPVDEPVTCRSFADFERTFGGLWQESHLGYSVRDFFRLGGARAVVVRVHTKAANDTAQLSVGSGPRKLTLTAASPGTWGSHLGATIDKEVRDPKDRKLFNLFVTDGMTGLTETFRNVSLDPDAPRRVDIVVNAESALVRVDPASLPKQPQSGNTAVATSTGGTNDGGPLTAAQFTGPGQEAAKRGLYALEKVDLFNLLVIPPYLGEDVDLGDRDVDPEVADAAITYAGTRRAVVVLDPPSAWTSVDKAVSGVANLPTGAAAYRSHAAVYFPRVRQPDPLRDGRLMAFAPSGAVAGIMAATDASRGVWKAPAGLDATLPGVAELTVPLTDQEIGALNPLGVNCLRVAPEAGHVVWGARTREGSDRLGSEWKYLPVRRTALYLEESLFRGVQWAVFEPNDEPLWGQLRLNIGAFLNDLFRKGAFQGRTPREAYFVRCDRETTTQSDIDRGIVNIHVGFAPLKPAEFVVLRLQQIAGQIPT